MSKLSAALWRRGGKGKKGLQLQVSPQGAEELFVSYC